MSAAEHEWTVLIIGDGPLGVELSEELERLGQDVDGADADNASTAVMVSAPDMVVLVGDAASDRGEAVLAALAAGHDSAVAPVMVIGDSSRAQVHPNYRHGPVAALSNKLPVPLLAKRVLELARDVPERTGEQTGRVTGEQLETLVEGLSTDKRSGTLDVTPDDSDESESLIMAGGESVSETTGEYVARLQPQLRGGPGSFRFKERSGGSTDSVAPPPPAGSVAPMSDPTPTAPPPPSVRILVVDGDPGRAESLAQALRDGGAIAEGIGGNVGALEGAARTDAQVVLMTPTHLRTKCKAVVAAIEAHPRLRWASTLLAPQGLLWPSDGSDANLDVLQRKFDKLTAPDRRLGDEARSGRTETRLEVIGPGRMLRAIAMCGEPRRVVVRHPRVKVAITVEAGSIVQATAKPVGQAQPVEGSAALATLFAIRSGRVEITPTKRAITLHSLPSIEDALGRALRIESPIEPSIMPPPGGLAAPSLPPRAPAAPPRTRHPQPHHKAAHVPPASPPPLAPTPRVVEDPEALLAPPSALFDPPSMQSEGSGVIELASAPLPLSAVLGQPPSSPLTMARGGTAELEFDLHPSASDDGDGDDEPLHVPRPAVVAAAGRAVDGVKRLSATGLQAVRGSLGPSRPAGARLDMTVAREAFAAGLTETRRAVSAVPPRLRYAGAAVLAVLFVGVALWPGTGTPPDASASAQTAIEPAAAEPAPVAEAAAAEAEGATTAIVQEAVAEPTELPPEDLAAEATDQGVDEPGVEDSDTPETPSPPEDSDRAERIAQAQELARAATRLRRQGRLGLAESKYIESLAAWPRYPLAIAGVVRLHLTRKDGREAVRWARRLVRVQPKRGNNQLLLGDAYMLRRKVESARKAYRQAARYGNRPAKKRLETL